MKRAEKMYYCNKLMNCKNTNSKLWKCINNILHSKNNKNSGILLNPLQNSDINPNVNIDIQNRFITNYFLNDQT